MIAHCLAHALLLVPPVKLVNNWLNQVLELIDEFVQLQ